MKIECEKSLLAAAIEGVSRAITNRSAIPVLEGIYLQAEGFKLTLTGYDMEMGITTTIDCNVLVPGEMVLDAKLLGSMVSRMPAGNVTIDMDDEGMAIISGGVAEFEIPAMNASDYPSLPNTKADYAISMPTAQLREMIEKTIYAVATDDKKPAHTGELFVMEPGRLTIVALDGYRLAVLGRSVECKRDIRIIIPAKTLQELLKVMGGPEDPVQIDATAARVLPWPGNWSTALPRASTSALRACPAMSHDWTSASRSPSLISSAEVAASSVSRVDVVCRPGTRAACCMVSSWAHHSTSARPPRPSLVWVAGSAPRGRRSESIRAFIRRISCTVLGGTPFSG